MTTTNTTFIELTKPDFRHPAWHTDLNLTLDRIDTIGEHGTESDPTGNVASLWIGRKYVDTSVTPNRYWVATNAEATAGPSTWIAAGEAYIESALEEEHQWEKHQYAQWKDISSSSNTLTFEMDDGPYYDLILDEDINSIVFTRAGAPIASDDWAGDIKLRITKGNFEYSITWTALVDAWPFGAEPVIPLNSRAHVVLTKTTNGLVEGAYVTGFGL